MYRLVSLSADIEKVFPKLVKDLSGERMARGANLYPFVGALAPQ